MCAVRKPKCPADAFVPSNSEAPKLIGVQHAANRAIKRSTISNYEMQQNCAVTKTELCIACTCICDKSQPQDNENAHCRQAGDSTIHQDSKNDHSHHVYLQKNDFLSVDYRYY